MRTLIIIVIISAGCCGFISNSFAWHDETHLAISKSAGYSKWYNSAGADITKEKAHKIEQFNHYYDADATEVISPQLVIKQANDYNKTTDAKGHLYGAIIASLRAYNKAKEKGKYEQYHMAFCAHYVGDLSQPFHNLTYDDFNKTHHIANDATVESEALANIEMIKSNMYIININKKSFESDVATEVARIANISRKLGIQLKLENREMAKKEAYQQLGHSASLLKAILSSISE